MKIPAPAHLRSANLAVEQLNLLLETEQTSILRFLSESYPYLGPAAAELRKPLTAMVNGIVPRMQCLADWIDRLGGFVTARASAENPEDQYLGYLSFEFLLPRLLKAKAEIVQTYEAALTNLPADPTLPRGLQNFLTAALAEHRAQFLTLKQAGQGGSK